MIYYHDIVSSYVNLPVGSQERGYLISVTRTMKDDPPGVGLSKERFIAVYGMFAWYSLLPEIRIRETENVQMG